jgi:hypothetical protein
MSPQLGEQKCRLSFFSLFVVHVITIARQIHLLYK